MKKIIIPVVLGVVVLILASGGFFYWQNNQKDIQGLNKNLPTGVKVAKNIFGFGNEYKVINKIDGYQFKIPSAWKGVDEIEYNPKRTEKKYTIATIELAGKLGGAKIIVLNRFYDEKTDLTLNEWTRDNFNTFSLVGDFSRDKIGDLEIVKTQENVHLLGMWVYFFKKDTAIYAITGGSEEFIREIISNGKW